MRFEFVHDLLRQTADFIGERTVAEFQIVERDEFSTCSTAKRHAHSDADRTDGQKFDGALDAHRAERAIAFRRRQADHLRLVKKQLARAAFAASTANCATGWPSSSRIGLRAVSYATSNA